MNGLDAFISHRIKRDDTLGDDATVVTFRVEDFFENETTCDQKQESARRELSLPCKERQQDSRSGGLPFGTRYYGNRSDDESSESSSSDASYGSNSSSSLEAFNAPASSRTPQQTVDDNEDSSNNYDEDDSSGAAPSAVDYRGYLRATREKFLQLGGYGDMDDMDSSTEWEEVTIAEETVVTEQNSVDASSQSRKHTKAASPICVRQCFNTTTSCDAPTSQLSDPRIKEIPSQSEPSIQSYLSKKNRKERRLEDDDLSAGEQANTRSRKREMRSELEDQVNGSRPLQLTPQDDNMKKSTEQPDRTTNRIQKTDPTIPEQAQAFKAVSISFLASNIPSHTAHKVLEESLRIIKPGGRLYVVDFDGATMSKIDPRYQALFERVTEFDPYEMAAHGMQENEIQNILLNIGKARCYQQGSIARWVGVKPPSLPHPPRQ